MSDFMNWLYANYIKPYVAAQPMDDGDKARSVLLDCETTPEERADVHTMLRFYASHAFLLGLRTGTGLAQQDGQHL